MDEKWFTVPEDKPEEKPPKKFCPLLLMHETAWACEEDKCAWWRAEYEMCAVADLAASLDSIRIGLGR